MSDPVVGRRDLAILPLVHLGLDALHELERLVTYMDSLRVLPARPRALSARHTAATCSAVGAGGRARSQPLRYLRSRGVLVRAAKARTR
jgi:hypothetical protein